MKEQAKKVNRKKDREYLREAFVRWVTVSILFFNVLRQLFIAAKTGILENVFFALFWLFFMVAIALKKDWARDVVINIYRVFFIIGLIAVALVVMGKDIGYLFSLFFYAENLKLTTQVILKGLFLLIMESFCMVLMLDDKPSVIKASIAGIFMQIFVPVLFFIYLGSLYSAQYVAVFSKYVRFDQTRTVIHDVGTHYYFSEKHDFRIQTPEPWLVLLKEDLARHLGISTHQDLEMVLVKILKDAIVPVQVKAFKTNNPADAYADLEGFRLAMLAEDQVILKDKQIPSQHYEIYEIITYADAKADGRALFRVITPRLVVDFFLSYHDREQIFISAEELEAVVLSLKLY